MTGNAPRGTWTPEDLRYLDRSRELEIAAPRVNGDRGRWTPIWVVVADDEVFVRTWQRRSTGWYGHAVGTERAWIRLPGRSVEVTVAVKGDADADVIDAAYRTKYAAAAAQSIVTPEAAASTLRLTPAV